MASFLSHINQVPNLATDLQNIDMRREIQDQVALDKGVPHISTILNLIISLVASCLSHLYQCLRFTNDRLGQILLHGCQVASSLLQTI